MKIGKGGAQRTGVQQQGLDNHWLMGNHWWGGMGKLGIYLGHESSSTRRVMSTIKCGKYLCVRVCFFAALTELSLRQVCATPVILKGGGRGGITDLRYGSKR